MMFLTQAAWLDDMHPRPICGRGLVKRDFKSRAQPPMDALVSRGRTGLGSFSFLEGVGAFILNTCIYFCRDVRTLMVAISTTFTPPLSLIARR